MAWGSLGTSYVSSCPLNANLPIKPNPSLCARAFDHLNKRCRSQATELTLLDSWSDFMVSAMYLMPSMALFTSGCLIRGEWKPMGGGPGFPEMSEISMSSVKIFLSCFSLDGLFIVEKNMIFGIVSIKTYNKIKKKSTYGNYCQQGKHQTLILNKQCDLWRIIQLLWASASLSLKQKDYTRFSQSFLICIL